MKKTYLITIILLLLFSGAILWGSTNKSNKSYYIEKEQVVFQEKNNTYQETDNVKVEVEKKEIKELSGQLVNSKINIFDSKGYKTGMIDLILDNPYIQVKRGRNLPLFKTNTNDFHFYTFLDNEISFQKTENDTISDFIGVTFSGITNDYEQSSSVIKVYNRYGQVIFDSGVVFDKYYLNPRVSPNGKYLAVYSSIYEDEKENFKLVSENKIDFYDIKTGQKITLTEQNILRDKLYNGSFKGSDLFIAYNNGYANIVDLNNKIFYRGKKEPGRIIKVTNEGELYSVNYRDKTDIIKVTNKFSKQSL